MRNFYSSSFTQLPQLQLLRWNYQPLTRSVSSQTYHAAYTVVTTGFPTRLTAKRFVTPLSNQSHSARITNSNHCSHNPSQSLNFRLASTSISRHTMPDMDELTSTLKAGGLSEVPKYHDTYPELNPIDVYRSHITELLAPVAGVEPKVIYLALSWTATLDKGDLLLPVPALRVKGKKPKELVEELSNKV